MNLVPFCFGADWVVRKYLLYCESIVLLRILFIFSGAKQIQNQTLWHNSVKHKSSFLVPDDTLKVFIVLGTHNFRRGAQLRAEEFKRLTNKSSLMMTLLATKVAKNLSTSSILQIVSFWDHLFDRASPCLSSNWDQLNYTTDTHIANCHFQQPMS